MSDPTERLNQLRDEVEGAPMPPAAEVRRRGDRLRRRRTVAVTAAVAAAVVAIVAPVAALTSGETREDGPVEPAGPSTSATVPPAVTLTEANLMTEADTEFDGTSQWRVGETSVGDDRAEANACQQASITDLGAEGAFQRTWGLEAHGLNQVIAEFPSAEAARSAYDDVAEWLTSCAPPGAIGQPEAAPLSGVSVPSADEALAVRTAYQLDGEEGGEAFNDHLLFTGVAVAGDRLTMLSHDAPDGDYGAIWGDRSPVERMLPAAVDRLGSAAATGEDSARTDIPAQFPVDRGLSAPEGDPISGPGPAATGINPLDICEGTQGVLDAQWPREPVERLAASAPGPEYLDARELITLPDEAEAEGVLADIRLLVEDCAESGDGMVWTIHDDPRLGEEGLALSRTYDLGLGGDVYVFTRVGNAVLAVDRMGEWELTSSVPAGIDEVTDIAAAIAPDLCIYAADGC